jgi:diguanylate cyclase (GGDEF)-like protein
VSDNEVYEILDSLKIFEKMYEVIRIVDPVKKKVFSYRNNLMIDLNLSCFSIWEKNKICDNCVSVRAYNEDQNYIKIEYTPQKVYMVTAIPIIINNEKMVIELLKDSTNSILFADGDKGMDLDIHTMIDNLNNLALQDSLTGIYNRRYINEKLPVDLINAVLLKQSISIIMTDIDFFKKINDNYGHLAGDIVLKEFAKILGQSIKRESDWVSRYGGEEFIICLPGANLDKAKEIAENIRKVVEAKEIVAGNQTVKITASFGVCSVKPVEGKNSMESLIELADQKLYEAKNNGRNRVEG